MAQEIGSAIEALLPTQVDLTSRDGKKGSEEFPSIQMLTPAALRTLRAFAHTLRGSDSFKREDTDEVCMGNLIRHNPISNVSGYVADGRGFEGQSSQIVRKDG